MFALVCTPLMAAWLSNLSKARSVMAHRVFGKLEAGKQWAVLWNLMCTTGSILLASLFFNAIEEWDFSDAVYFSFISITTIGYGDLAPVTPIGRCVFLIFYISSVAWASVLVGALHKYFSKHFFHAIRSCCRGWGDILIPLVAFRRLILLVAPAAVARARFVPLPIPGGVVFRRLHVLLRHHHVDSRRWAAVMLPLLRDGSAAAVRGAGENSRLAVGAGRVCASCSLSVPGVLRSVHAGPKGALLPLLV